MKKRLYIDVDGVLLSKHNTQAASGVIGLLDYIIEHYDCYWLTTHCHGDTGGLLKMMSQYFSFEYLEKMRDIKPTQWDALKTEAIDFSSDFYWLDDYVFNAEKEVLKNHLCSDRLIIVDLDKKDELKRVKDLLITLQA